MTFVCLLVECMKCSEYFVQLFEPWTCLVCILACVRLCVTSQLSGAPLTFWTRGTYYYVMEIDAVPRRTYYYVLDLHGFNNPAQVSVVHDWTPTWTRGLTMSHCVLRRKKNVDCTWEAGVSTASVFSDFQRYCTKGAWLHASFAWRTSSKHILQTMKAILSIFWMTSVIFGQVFRRN